MVPAPDEDKPLARVRVLPAGIEFEVEAHESVAEAAWRQDYTWPTKCWGQAECMTCLVRVVGGETHVRPAEDEEVEAMRTLLPRRLRKASTRLGCRIRVDGDGVVLEKRGVLPPQ